MKNFLAIYVGTAGAMEKWRKLDESTRKEREQTGMRAWGDWMKKHSASIVETGGPLGKTKKVSARGTDDVRNAMTGFVIVKAESQDAAAKMFEEHPHFTIFPGDAVEIMEILPIPGQ